MRLAVLCWLLVTVAIAQDVGDPFSSDMDPGSNDETTDAPSVTTETPSITTETPSVTTETPSVTTETPSATTEAPVATTEAPEVTESPETLTPETDAPVASTPPPTTESPTTPTPSPPVVTTETPPAPTAAPVVKHYNSSTLPPGVDSSMLNGTKLDTVEVTETTDADGTTSYSYTIITTSGDTETKIIWTPSSANNGDSSAATQPGSSLSDTNGDKKTSSGAGTLIAIIVAAVVFMVVAFAFLVSRRRRDKNRHSSASSDDAIVLPAVGKQERLLDNGMLADAEYQDVSKTAVNSRSSGDSRRHQSTLWEDPVITAARIPIDRVEMGAIISRGGFGEVHHGRYRGQDVAIKTLLPEKRKDMQYIQAFLSEVRLMATMEHPYIVQFIGVAWEALSDLYCVSEFMAGGDLRSLLRDYLATGVPQGMDASKMQIAYQVAYALTYLHSLEPVVLHRDLKSRNILLTPSLDAKITDFGASRIRSDATMTAGVGSSMWMAPEVMMGNRYNEKADVFSLGVVLSELDTHEMPYSHAKESSVDSSTSGSRPLPDAAVLQMVSTGKLRVRFSRYMNPDMVRFARSCVDVDPRMRPTAAEVVYYLQVAIRNQQY